MSTSGALTGDVIDGFRTSFESDPKNRLSQNVVTKHDPLDSCLTRKTLETTNHVFTHKTDEFKPVTNQRSSGRCWIFACLNAARIPFIKNKSLDDFEFSQNYLFFWDKVERSNYFLNTVADSYRRTPKEEVGGRLVSFLLDQPISDGGQWDMVVNLIEKHGVMPKACFPEAYSCESSMRMNAILKSKLREFAREIHVLIDKVGNDDDEAVKALIQEQMNTIFRIVSICLGTPPKTFTWEYTDKSKKYHKVADISPLEFYNQHVRPVFDASEKVCLVTDPRPSNPPGRTYTVDCLGNVIGGKPTVYNNQTVGTLIDIAGKSIRNGEPVWFGCEVGKHTASKQGILDLDAHDYQLVFDTKVNLNMDKAQRLIYGDSLMNHAMVLTGISVQDDDPKEEVSGSNGKTSEVGGDGDKASDSAPAAATTIEDVSGKITKWRIENSWGEERNNKGYLVMTNDWFHEFVFEIVVDKKFCSQEVLDVFKLEPKVLPAWDPMGALARN